MGGVQYFTAPVTGTFDFVVAGAGQPALRSHNGVIAPLGAVVGGSYHLNAGAVLAILVGQQGGAYGGGGGSFVALVSSAGSLAGAVPLYVAGGAASPGLDGGPFENQYTNATTGAAGQQGYADSIWGPINGGFSGSGGFSGRTGDAACGGGGFYGDAVVSAPVSHLSVVACSGGLGFVNGGSGGAGSGPGGFGGGGGGGNTDGGGGGGYSGGGGGAREGFGAGGGGGGSYGVQPFVYTAVTNPGAGYVAVVATQSCGDLGVPDNRDGIGYGSRVAGCGDALYGDYDYVRGECVGGPPLPPLRPAPPAGDQTGGDSGSRHSPQNSYASPLSPRSNNYIKGSSDQVTGKHDVILGNYDHIIGNGDTIGGNNDQLLGDGNRLGAFERWYSLNDARCDELTHNIAASPAGLTWMQL